jgi:hypothetical protein
MDLERGWLSILESRGSRGERVSEAVGAVGSGVTGWGRVTSDFLEHRPMDKTPDDISIPTPDDPFVFRAPSPRTQRKGWRLRLWSWWRLYGRPWLTGKGRKKRREVRRLASMSIKEMEALWWPTSEVFPEGTLSEPETRALLTRVFPGNVSPGLGRQHVPEGLLTKEGREAGYAERNGKPDPVWPDPTPEQVAQVEAGTHTWVCRHVELDSGDGLKFERVLLPYDFRLVSAGGTVSSLREVSEKGYGLVITEDAVVVRPRSCPRGSGSRHGRLPRSRL